MSYNVMYDRTYVVADMGGGGLEGSPLSQEAQGQCEVHPRHPCATQQPHGACRNHVPGRQKIGRRKQHATCSLKTQDQIPHLVAVVAANDPGETAWHPAHTTAWHPVHTT